MMFDKWLEKSQQYKHFIKKKLKNQHKID